MHCIRKNGIEDNSWVSIDSFKLKVIPFAISYFKNIHLIITGGEPTLAVSFHDIVNHSVEAFNKVSICTNGINLDEIFKLECLKNKIEIQISLDGDAEGHNLVRGTNVFEIVFNNFKKLYDKKFKLHISTVVHKLNKDSVKRLAYILKDYPDITWSISAEQAFNESSQFRALSCGQWNTFVDEMLSISSNKMIIRKLFDFDLFQKIENRFGKQYIRKYSTPNCGFGISKIYIYPDLSIHPCTCIDMKIGNLNFDSSESIIKQYKQLKITPSSGSKCNDCRWVYFCNGGCPGYSYYRTGKFDQGDSRCPLIQ